ncbi:hypothetical protein LPW11_03220 [Geomonas sp. RF6]|uniref:hypothetical protein n=1 Tax=Geomonas sp. RF6 TaxID=2897342 RepID=UPI001E52860E|nr:hypothetical protein [Geomonas sp. RF6]UFS71209.1 hypothetical protein LPW11_03220 [Geomonas sp. RF6]
MLKRAVSAGDTVESQCTRCKSLLNHTVVAMVDGRVVRVKCNTCGSEHNHREVKEPKAPVQKSVKAAAAPKTPRAKAAKAPVISDEEVWEELIRPLDPDLAVPYSMDGRFRPNTLLSHPSFGIGVVSSSQSGKIEVVFKAGRKLLRCAA